MFWKRISVADQTRALVIRNGRFDRILRPGDHLLFVSPLDRVSVETFQTRESDFLQRVGTVPRAGAPGHCGGALARIETSDVQVTLVFVEKRLWRVLPPDSG